jgi:DNA-binding response OmpR family regulator
MRIVIIEDDAIILEMLTEVCQNEGFEVISYTY